MSPALDINAIVPALDAKYSVNLYEFLTSPRMAARILLQRAYRDVEGVLWLGRKDDDAYLLGARLISVLCEGARTQTFAHPGHRQSVEVVDFWPRYQAIGRCAIDTEHEMVFIGDDQRWQVEGDTRTCRWCGQAHQRLERWIEPVERTRWVPAGVADRAPVTAGA